MTKDEARKSAFKEYERKRIPNMSVPRIVDEHAFNAGFDAGYNAHSGWVRVHEQLPEAGEDKLWRQTPHDAPMVGYLDNERERVYRAGGSSYEHAYTFQYWADIPPFTEQAGQSSHK